MQALRFEIETTWDGGTLRAEEFARLDVEFRDDDLMIDVDAAFFNDPAPAQAPGSLSGLWDFEVVELFLVGRESQTLEIELGPHGHYCVLELAGPRQVRREGVPIEYEAERVGDRFEGRARLSRALLPPDLQAANAFAIHGVGSDRRYLAASALPGPAPDFHRLSDYPPLSRYVR